MVEIDNSLLSLGSQLQSASAARQNTAAQTAATQQSTAKNQMMMPYEQQQAQQTLDTGHLKNLQTKNQMVSQLLGTVVDQPSWDRAVSQAETQGLDVSRFKGQPYNQQVVQQLRFGAASATAQLSALMQQKQMELRAGLGTQGGGPETYGWTPGMSSVVPSQSVPVVQTSAPQPAPMPVSNMNGAPQGKTPLQPLAASMAQTVDVTGPSPNPMPVEANSLGPQAMPLGGPPPDTVTPRNDLNGARPSAMPNGSPVPNNGESVQSYKARVQAWQAQQKYSPDQQGMIERSKEDQKNASDLAAAAPKKAAEAGGTESVDIAKNINDEADKALATKRLGAEMMNLSQDIQLGRLAPLKQKIGAWAVQVGFDKDTIDKEIGNVDDMQAMGKLTAQLATQAMKSFTSRGTQMEFATFLANNPNIEMTPGGFQKVIGFLDKTADIPLAKQSAFMDWKKGKSPADYQDFSAEWNQRMLKDMKSTLTQPGPSAHTTHWAVKDGKLVQSP